MNLKEKQNVVFKFSILFILVLNVNGQIMRTEEDIMKAAVHADKMRTLTRAKSKSNSGGGITQNLFGSADDIAGRAGQALQDGVYQENRSYNVSKVCLQDTEAFLEALLIQEMWALKSKSFINKTVTCWLNHYVINSVPMKPL